MARSIKATTFHRSFGGGRYAYVDYGNDIFKVVETASGAVFVEYCDRAGMPRKELGDAVTFDSVDAALLELSAGPAVNAWESR